MNWSVLFFEVLPACIACLVVINFLAVLNFRSTLYLLDESEYAELQQLFGEPIHVKECFRAIGPGGGITSDIGLWRNKTYQEINKYPGLKSYRFWRANFSCLAEGLEIKIFIGGLHYLASHFCIRKRWLIPWEEIIFEGTGGWISTDYFISIKCLPGILISVADPLPEVADKLRSL